MIAALWVLALLAGWAAIYLVFVALGLWQAFGLLAVGMAGAIVGGRRLLR